MLKSIKEKKRYFLLLASCFLLLVLSFPNCAEFSDVMKTSPDSRPRNIGRHDKAKKSRSSKKHKKKKKDDTIYVSVSEEGFIWPLDRKITSFFGKRGRRHHDGVDIPAPYGTPIRAAKSGVVIHYGRISSYGRLLVIKHAGSFFSAYAHMSRSNVREGQRVKWGEVIGSVGRSGRARSPHLHFEIRRRTKAIDPLIYLPKRRN